MEARIGIRDVCRNNFAIVTWSWSDHSLNADLISNMIEIPLRINRFLEGFGMVGKKLTPLLSMAELCVSRVDLKSMRLVCLLANVVWGPNPNHPACPRVPALLLLYAKHVLNGLLTKLWCLIAKLRGRKSMLRCKEAVSNRILDLFLILEMLMNSASHPGQADALVAKARFMTM
jgi:hypothetical protein